MEPTRKATRQNKTASAETPEKATGPKSAGRLPKATQATSDKTLAKKRNAEEGCAKPQAMSAKKHEWRVESDCRGLRLDAILARRHVEISRSLLQEMIKSGEALVDGIAVKPSHKLRGGEIVTYKIPKIAEQQPIASTPLDFPILFEDHHMIAVEKPVGLVVHPGAGREEKSVVSALLSYTKLSPIGAPLRPGVVHRLDKTTSGIMVLAKTERAHKRLAKMFAGHTIAKEYMAIVQGAVEADRGRVEVAIERDRVHRKRMRATRQDRGRMAISHYEVVERFPGATLVRVRIETGRTHQIRVHMSYIGHPLCGDILYGGRPFLGKSNHYLHSARLAMKHPFIDVDIEWLSPLPAAFEAALTELRNRGGTR
ncbi:MAG: RluA family pseudouridine synthase [Candidatus Riflebacteria bacterium]|nr:RluA family pseudouridine synthase [Candidatus Riflebacteria bacterium]